MAAKQPATTAITWEARDVYMRFSGVLSCAEYAGAQEAILADPEVDTIRYIINDFLAVDGYKVSREPV
jgi:hypothetical protein